MAENKTGVYAITQCSYWAGYCVLSAFASFYLLGLGASNTIVGVVLAIGSLMAAFLQPLCGALSDRFAWAKPSRLMGAAALLVIVCAALLLVLGANNLIVVCVVYCVMLMFMQTVQALLNILSMRCLNAGCSLNFGAARAVGSVGYAVTAYVIGQVSVHAGSGIVPAMMIASAVVLAGTTMFYPRQMAVTVPASAEDSKAGKGFLRRYPRYFLLLVGLVLVYYSHMMLNNFTLQIMETKGGGSAEMGTATAIAATAEIIAMLLCSPLMKKMKASTLIRISGVFFALKALASLLAVNVTGFYLAQLLQMFAWGVISVALVYYVNHIVAPEDIGKGQAYAAMTITVGTVLSTLVGGRLIDSCGVTVLLVTGVVVSAVGAVIMFVGTAGTKSR